MLIDFDYGGAVVSEGRSCKPELEQKYVKMIKLGMPYTERSSFS